MLLRHSVLYLLARGLPGAINFLAIAVYTRLLTPEEYGRYALVIAGVGFCNVVLFQWLKLSLLRFLPAHLQNPAPLLSTVLAGFSTLALLTGVAGLLLACLWVDSTWRGLVLIAVPLLWLQAWFELNLELARSRLHPVRYGLMNGVKAVSALGLGVWAVLWGLGTYGPLLGLLVGTLLTVLLWGRREWSIGRVPSLNLLRDLLSYGLPLTATFALSFVVNTSDRFLIARLLGEGPAGIYAAAYDVGQQTLTLLMMVVNLAAYPLAVRALEQKGPEAAQRQLRQNATLLLAVALPAAVGLAVLAPNVTAVFLGTSFQEGTVPLLSWVSLASLLSGIRAYHFDLAFQLGRYTLGQLWVVAAAAVLNLVLNLWWIPRLGVLGAAYATFAAYFLALLLSVVLGRRVLPMPIPYRDGLKIALASLLMGLLLWPSLKYQGAYALVTQVTVGAVAYAVLVWFLNVGGYRTKLLRRPVT